MLSTYLTGLTMMAALIMPIGMQNAFVLNQGIRKQHHLMVAGFCSLSDAFFMCLGVFGGAALFSAYPSLLLTITALGVMFMGYYGWLCFKRAYRGEYEQQQARVMSSRKTILLACAAFTFLNPHVYIDTLVILGGFAANIEQQQRLYFIAGGTTASIAWFFTLAQLGAKLAPILAKQTAQRIIDLIIGIMMWVLGIYLLNFAVSGLS